MVAGRGTAALLVGLLALGGFFGLSTSGEEETAASEGVTAAATFTRNLANVRWHAVRIDLPSGSTDLRGTLWYNVSSFFSSNTRAPQQGFAVFDQNDRLRFGFHAHYADGQPYLYAAAGEFTLLDQSGSGINRFACCGSWGFLAQNFGSGPATTFYLVYWSSGPTDAEIQFTWTTGVTAITDSSGAADTFAFAKPDFGGVQYRDGPPCNPTCEGIFLGAGAAMTKSVNIGSRFVGAFLPNPQGNQTNTNESVNPDFPTLHASRWTSPSGRTQVMVPVQAGGGAVPRIGDDQIFIVGHAGEIGAWSFEIPADLDLNPVYAVLSGVDVALP